MKILLRLLKLLLPSWRLVLAGIFLSLFAMLANLGLLALSSWFIASMAVAGSLGAFMDDTLPAAAVRALALARAGGRYAERLVNHDATLRVLSTLRVWFFRRIEPLAPAQLSAHRSGDLLSRVRADVDTLDDFYLRGVVPAVVAVLAACCIVAFLASFDPRLAGIDLAGLAVAGLALPLLLRWRAAGPGRKRVEYAAELRASVVEQAQGMAELIVLGAVQEREARLGRVSRSLDRAQAKLSGLQGIGEAGLVAASSLAVWATAFVTAPLVLAGTRGGAQFAMLTVFVLATFESVVPLPAVIQRAGEIAAAARRLFELIDARPQADEPAHPASPPDISARLGLSISELGFRYAADQRWILDGFSLHVPTGRSVGIAGPTGVGKSTLVGLLLRFRDCEKGRIAVFDDAGSTWELSKLRGDDARQLFAVMEQSPHLFHASLRENLVLALPDDRQGDDALLLDALKTAQLADFVAGLPQGLETTVGETGRELSGGEARRVALARTLLKDAPIYVLDEPTEGLDEETADALMKAVARRLRGRTLIVISHREKDLAVVDSIVRMGPG